MAERHTVKTLIEELKKFPMDAFPYAYEGEITGVVVRSSNDRRELGHVPASAGSGGQAVHAPKPSKSKR